MVMCLYYSMLPVKNTFMYLAIMCQPVDDGSYKASQAIIQQHNIRHIRAVNVRCVGVWGGGGGGGSITMLTMLTVLLSGCNKSINAPGYPAVQLNRPALVSEHPAVIIAHRNSTQLTSQ